MRKVLATSTLAVTLLVSSLAGCISVDGTSGNSKPTGKPAPAASASASSSPSSSAPDNSLMPVLDPCSLIQTNDVRAITGDKRIVGPGKAEIDYYGYKRCNYLEKPQIGLPSFYVATSFAVTQDDFLKIPRFIRSGKSKLTNGYYTDKLDVQKSLLKDKADSAFVVYIDPKKSLLHGPNTRPQFADRIAVLKDGNVIVIQWPGRDKSTNKLEQLAVVALDTIEAQKKDIPFYPGK